MGTSLNLELKFVRFDISKLRQDVLRQARRVNIKAKGSTVVVFYFLTRPKFLNDEPKARI